MNPIVFIVGAPRSGNTLLRRLIDAHPEIAVVDETHWIAKWLTRGRGLTPDRRVTPAFVRRLAEYHRFARWQIPLASLEELVSNGSMPTYGEFVTRFFDIYGEVRGKALVGDKTPRYVREIPTLHALWPTAKFVQIIRDGRDVCLSANTWRKAYKLRRRYATWPSDPVSTAGAWWDWLVRCGRAEGSRLGPDLYYEIRYERLVADPAAECAAVCSFLGVAFDHRMLRFHEGHQVDDPRLDAKQAWRPVTPGLRSWATEMPPNDVERFEAIAGGLLRDLGYPRAFPRPGAETLRRAAWVRKRFQEKHGVASGAPTG
jgi:Sulfotransferase family